MTALMALLIALIAVMIIVAFVIERRETEELSTGQESYIDWDSVIAVPWEELVINQTVNAQETILSKHIYFFCDGEIVKKLRIPSNIIFVAGEDKPEPIRVLRARKNMYLYEYLGERFLHLCELPEDIVGRSCLPSSKLTAKLYLIKPYY